MPLSRLYNTTADAVGAVDDLKLAGFSDDLIKFVAQGPSYISGAALIQVGILARNAERYLVAVRAGAVLLIVDPPLGFSAAAAQILETPRPGDTGVAKAVYEGGSWDEATPISSAFHMPVLTDNPAPLSSALGLPVLSKDQTADDWSLGAPTLTANQRGPDKSLGFSTLSKGQRGPAKSMGFATLSKSQRGPDKSLGFATLSKTQRGKSGLLNNPAPLSSLLGLPTLIDRR